MNDTLTGLQRARRACVTAAGEVWCDEHLTGRYWGVGKCSGLHTDPDPGQSFDDWMMSYHND